jgi:rhodanese-related sulfurtransferase
MPRQNTGTILFHRLILTWSTLWLHYFCAAQGSLRITGAHKNRYRIAEEFAIKCGQSGVPMSNADQILQSARQRAKEQGVPYAGALLPAEAHTLITQMPQAKIVDVRSRAEFDFVGRIPASLEIEWKTYPGMQPNADFLRQLTEQVPKDKTLFFICRSGGRSHEAARAAAAAGYQAYNVLEGFEGDRDENGHRNSIGGWRAAGLPWIQS